MKKYVCEIYEKQYFGMFDKKLYFLMEADAPEEIEGIAAEESKYMMRSDEEIAEIIKMIAAERQEELAEIEEDNVGYSIWRIDALADEDDFEESPQSFIQSYCSLEVVR